LVAHLYADGWVGRRKIMGVRKNQATPNNANPTNTSETLKPSPIIKGKVQDYLNIGALNYSYA
jgi:hypothetical protein